MSDERDLPDGVIDAEPPGGWTDVDDGETQEQSDAAEGSDRLRSDAADDDPVSQDAVRSDGVDPDLSTQEES